MTNPAQSAIDFSHYLPPGVYTQAFPGPQLAVNSSLPTAVGIIGQTVGFQTYVETIIINPDTDDVTPSLTRTLTQSGINLDTLVVANPNSGVAYVLGTDYTTVQTGGTANTPDVTFAIQRVIDGHINPGDYVQASYQYTDSQYFLTPTIFYDYDDVRNAYGQPFNLVTNEIQSELSLMAKFAFLNGAYQVVAVAVQPTGSGGTVATIGDYGNAIDMLKDQPLVAIVVVGSGQQPIHQLLQEHVDQQSLNRHERRAICAMDGTVVPVPSSQRILNAQAITDTRILMICPTTFNYFSPEINQATLIGGQYIAASLAGLTLSMSWAMPLTRKIIAGFTGVGELEQEGQKNLESQNGLCVVEMRRQLLQVRHGVSTDPTDLISREWSIIGQQDAMVFRLRDYLESANLIGTPIYPYTLINVKGSADAALQSLIRDGLIVDYTGLKVRQLVTNPDVLEVSFSWLPAWPLNYIVVTFNITLSTGNMTTTTGTSTNIANVTSAGQTTTQIGIPTSSVINDFGGASNTLQST